MEEQTATDRRFERAMLEALHAELVHVQGESEDAPLGEGDPIDRRIREWDHETRKWRIVRDAAKGWV